MCTYTDASSMYEKGWHLSLYLTSSLLRTHAIRGERLLSANAQSSPERCQRVLKLPLSMLVFNLAIYDSFYKSEIDQISQIACEF